ncbi:ATP-binding protein [Candidatus Colwellia aromaticivorans]|uniref:ATP-binding protein n=1 Tax=Candidatus Colwellia aromaticivorans TaxID=2267621 RepID=UPI000DF42AF4|nr:ATP-binding protein [Candidatus Colwellia aromaticivorans]
MSIRRYLVLTLFSVLTLITFIAAIQGYKVSMSRAEKQFDQQLLDIANTLLAVQTTAVQTSSLINTNNSNKTHPTAQVAQQGSFAFQVWKNDELLIKSNNAPDHLITSSVLSHKPLSHFSEANFLDKRWRVFALSNSTSAQDSPSISVIVAQPLQTQFALAQELILAAVTPMIIAIVILSFLIYIIITQGLKPLHQLRTELGKRNTNDFSPLDLQVNNTELADIVVTLNKLFSRLDAAFKRERHFAEDAAHELKTPLSVLKINVHNITQDFSARLSLDDLHVTANEIQHFDSIKELTNSVDRMGHVIDQILNLNRTNTAQIVDGSTRFNLNSLLQQVIAELYSDISAKEQTIVLESDQTYLCAHEFSVHLLAVNLISNANKYTPIGGKIKVTVKLINEDKDDRKIVLSVEDSGIGIAPQDYLRIFDRFYRVGGDQHNSSVLGCGLGLTIVKHIADVHGAKIELSPSTLLKGLKIDVYFKGSKLAKEQGDD